MEDIGFTCYEQPAVVPKPTIAEIIASLDNAQKLAVLNGFAYKVAPRTLYYNLKGKVSVDVIRALYKAIRDIRDYSGTLMRGDVETTPAETDPKTGEVITPAKMNTPPTSQTALKNAVASKYTGDFNATQVGAIITKMIKCTKPAEKGDWTFYRTNIVL